MDELVQCGSLEVAELQESSRLQASVATQEPSRRQPSQEQGLLDSECLEQVLLDSEEVCLG